MDESFHKRRTKSLKQKKTFELNGQYSQKHLRIVEELKKNIQIKNNVCK